MMGTDNFLAGMFVIRTQLDQQFSRKQCISIFFALSVFDLNKHCFTVDMFGFQGSDFIGPESGGVGGHQNKPVLEIVGGTD